MPSTDLDPMTTKAEKNNSSTQDKIKELHTIVKSAHTGMLATRAADGELHSRAMIPSAPYDDIQLTLQFVANNASEKFDEIQHDSHVNVSFCDTSTTSWASYSGIATVSTDKELIHKHWSPFMSAYFGDLKDGVHTGGEDDPRVSIITFVPNEVRYWVAKKGTVGKAISTAINAAMKTTAELGEIRTISKEEILLTQQLKQ